MLTEKILLMNLADRVKAFLCILEQNLKAIKNLKNLKSS